MALKNFRRRIGWRLESAHAAHTLGYVEGGQLEDALWHTPSPVAQAFSQAGKSIVQLRGSVHSLQGPGVHWSLFPDFTGEAKRFAIGSDCSGWKRPEIAGGAH